VRIAVALANGCFTRNEKKNKLCFEAFPFYYIFLLFLFSNVIIKFTQDAGLN